MLEQLGEALARRRSGVVVLALVDLDGFREVTDTLGRSGGDALLTSIAEHLKAGLPSGATLGRFEEDEFAVIIESDDPGVEDLLIESLRASLLRPIFIDRMWQITASIGIARAPDHGESGEEIVRRAGLALRAAKRAGPAAMPAVRAADRDRLCGTALSAARVAIGDRIADLRYRISADCRGRRRGHGGR